MSGRRRAQVIEDARLIGQTSYIFEAGCGLVLDGELSGSRAGWCQRGAGRSTTRSPPPARRRCCSSTTRAGSSTTSRGTPTARSPTCSAGWSTRSRPTSCSTQHGHGHLRLVDNGSVARRSRPHGPRADARLPPVPARGVEGEGGRRAHARARRTRPRTCIAVGDSREDIGAAGGVGTFWLVANAVEQRPDDRRGDRRHANVRVAEGRNSAGVYEAVVTTLAERRG